MADTLRQTGPWLTCLAVLALPACNLLVDVPVARTPELVGNPPAPLSTTELLRFSLENLGEVAPGLLYRSGQPDRKLLEFLARRVNLRHVITLRGKIREEERSVMESVGGDVTSLRMTMRRPPTVRQILELIRITHRARQRGESILIHCLAGADRTGVAVGIWRQLFQGVTDIDALKREAVLHRNLETFVPMTMETLRRFRPELFAPFVENPALIDDERLVAELESRYFQGQPLLSGRRGVTRGVLRAGAARVDLLSGQELPIQMATYGPLPEEATGVREPVCARAIFLDNGSTRLGIVSCDLLIMDLELRRSVLDRLDERDLGLDDVLLAATHTHTGIGGYVDHWMAEFYIMGPFRAALRDHLAERIAASLIAAEASLRPARLGVGRAFVEGLSFNRRVGSTVDPEVGILRITDAEGGPLAVVVNYAAHPILEPADGRLSPDYPGYLASALDSSHGFGLFLNGALGDLNAMAPGREDAWHEEGLARAVANRLATAVQAAIEQIPTQREVALGSMTALLTVPSTNPNVIPDLLFPLDWLVGWALDWPAMTPLQTVRVGDAALVAAATELSVRLGLRIKRRCPSPFPLVVAHANSYGGYAVAPALHGLSKIDPTSMVCMNGSTYGQQVVEAACDMLEEQWGQRVDPTERRLSPAGEARLERHGLTLAQLARARGLAIDREEKAAGLDLDPTVGQSRRPGAMGSDTIPDTVRLEIAWVYLDALRGGQGLSGRRSETTVGLHWRAVDTLEIGITGGYVESAWRTPGGGRDANDGARDLALTLRRPLELASDPLAGTALRLVPTARITAPTGKADSATPYAFAPATGLWRPGAGLGLELVWNTYRTLAVDTHVTSAIGTHDRRRPGELWESGLRYSERHGIVSFHMDMVAAVQFPDRRKTGLKPVDVDVTSFALGVRPGISFHLGGHVELTGQLRLPVARGGVGLEEGEGGLIGLTAGF